MCYSQAIAKFEEAETISTEINDQQGQGYALEGIGTAHRKLGRYQVAEKYYEAALVHLQLINDPVGIQITEIQKATMLRMKGDKRAKELYHKCSSISIDLKRPGDLVRIDIGQAELARSEGNFINALSSYEQAHHRAEELGLKLQVAHAILGVAETNRLLSNCDLELYEQALSIYRKSDLRAGIIHTLIGKGLAYLVLKESDKATETLKTAHKYSKLLGLDREVELIVNATKHDLHPLDL